MLSFFTNNQESELQRKCCEWFLAYRHALLAYARQQADSRTDVELLISSVCRRVTRAICSGGVPEADIAPYTLRSLYNAAATLRRKNAQRMSAEQRFIVESGMPGDLGPGVDRSGLEDVHILARRALRSLPEELSTVVTLRVWCEMTFAEIAAKLHTPETTVRRRYEKGLRQIKKLLNQA